MRTYGPFHGKPLSRTRAICCALLDAFALQTDLAATAGRFPILRAPLAIGARGIASFLRFWPFGSVDTLLGLGWIIETYQRGKHPPSRRS